MDMNFGRTTAVQIFNVLRESGLSDTQSGSGATLRRLASIGALAASLLTGCATAPLTPAQTDVSYTIYTDANPALCNSPDTLVTNSVVRVATDDGGDASGVVVAPDRVLTAAHVVHEAGSTLVSIGGSYRQAQLLALDQRADLALLAVRTGDLRPLPLARKTLYDYEQVWAIGYPLALEQVTSHGFLRNRTEERLFTSAPIDAGASGGGLVRCENGHFELAGIIRGYAGYRVGEDLIPVHDLSIHTPADRIQRFIFQTRGAAL